MAPPGKGAALDRLPRLSDHAIEVGGKRAYDLAYAHAYKKSEGPVHERRYTADILTMAQREEADIAEIAFKHAERTAKALEKELMAWQSINSSMRAMYSAVRA